MEIVQIICFVLLKFRGQLLEFIMLVSGFMKSNFLLISTSIFEICFSLEEISGILVFGNLSIDGKDIDYVTLLRRVPFKLNSVTYDLVDYQYQFDFSRNGVGCFEQQDDESLLNNEVHSVWK
jgi:hypothetical protein